jgi:hypothetical protein
MIDKQRISAVAKLEELGYTFCLADGRTAPGTSGSAGAVPSTAESDAMHAVLVRRADALQECTEGSPEEAELEMIVSAIEPTKPSAGPMGRSRGARVDHQRGSGSRRQETFACLRS